MQRGAENSDPSDTNVHNTWNTQEVRGFELENVLPAGLGSKDQLVGDQTMQACWGEYLRARWDYWGPEVWISSHQTPLEVDQAWEASSHLFTTQAGFSPSQHHSRPGGPWDGFRSQKP